MKTVFCFAVGALVIFSAAAPASARKKAARKPTPNKAEIEAATRLRTFLDRASLSLGKIDGRYNECTRKALALYRESRGEQFQATPPQACAKPNAPPDVGGLDLASGDPVFVQYTVTEADLQNIGPSPNEPAQQAKLKFLPYRAMRRKQPQKNFTATFTFWSNSTLGNSRRPSRAIS